jgi:hypothetical protein
VGLKEFLKALKGNGEVECYSQKPIFAQVVIYCIDVAADKSFKTLKLPVMK